MNINKMIDMLFIVLSKNHDIFYIERRTYKKNKVYKSYIVNIDKKQKEFKRKTDLLIYLKEMV